MFTNNALNKKEHLSSFTQKIITMTPQERQEFFYGRWAQARQKTQPNWSGFDWSDKADKTIKFKHMGSTIEII